MAETASVENEQPTYINYKEGYDLFKFLRIEADEFDKLLANHGGTPQMTQGFWYEMGFKATFTSSILGQYYKLRFEKKHNTDECDVIYPDPRDEEKSYKFGIITLQWLKKIWMSGPATGGKEKVKTPYKKFGALYYQISGISKAEWGDQQTPCGVYLNMQKICAKFFQVITEGDWMTMGVQSFICHEEPTFMIDGEKIKVRTLTLSE